MTATAQNLQFDYSKYGFRDEEKYLFPRRSQIDNPDLHSALAKMDEPEHDHRRKHRCPPKLNAQEEIFSTGQTSDVEVAAFRAAASPAGMYKLHIAVENELTLPWRRDRYPVRTNRRLRNA